jgi:WD40 repeat protein
MLWSSCLAMLAVGVNSTAIMAALPDMRTELFLSSAGVEWAVNAYLVVSAAFIVLGGQAADRFGARLVSMAGLALGLRVLSLEDCSVQVLTTEPDNLPGWSPDGSRIVFTRRWIRFAAAHQLAGRRWACGVEHGWQAHPVEQRHAWMEG